MTRSSSMIEYPVSASRYQCVVSGWKNLAKSKSDRAAARRWFADLLWIAFPSASEFEVCQKASSALGVSPRTVGNWLSCQNDAPAPVMMKVLVITGAEIIFSKYEDLP